MFSSPLDPASAPARAAAAAALVAATTFDRDGLCPVIAQDAATGVVRMFATPVLASPAPDTTGTAAAKTAPAPATPTTAPAAPTTTTPTPAPGPTDPTQPTPNPSEPGRQRPTATTPTPVPAPTPSERPGETRPANPSTTSPASPSGILNERTLPEPAAAALTPAQAKQAQTILTELHKNNELEISLGSLARERASSDAVKEYAKELVDTHQLADKKLLDYAAARGLALAVSASPDAAGAIPGAGAPIAPTKFGEPRPTTGTDLGAPAGAATGAVGRHGATAGNPGAAAAGNPTVTTPTNPGATTATTPGREPTTGVIPTPATDMVSPPPQLDTEGRKLVERLGKLEGSAFDKAFLTTMVRNHGKSLSKIKSFESKKLESELSALLGDSRTMVENHLRRAKELQREASTALPPESSTIGALR